MIAIDCNDRECGDCPSWNPSIMDCDDIDRNKFERDIMPLYDIETFIALDLE